MKIKALYKDKWHNVEDIAKCDDGVEYQLEGINGKTYAKDIKDLDKGEVTNPDGSVTRFDGKEQLKKPLSKGINLLDKWALIKSKLNHNTAFQDMDIFANDEEDNKDEAKTTETGSANAAGPAEQLDPTAGGDNPQPAGQAAGEPQQPGSDDAERGGAVEEPTGPVESDAGLQQPEASAEEDAGAPTGDAEQSGDLPPLEGEQLEEALKELGYSQTEIAYIIHGHSPAIPSEEEMKAQQSKQNMSQDNEGHKQTLNQRSEEHDMDLDHKKKLNDLELDYAKREKELKLKHLEEELSIKRDKMKSKDSSGSGK